MAQPMCRVENVYSHRKALNEIYMHCEDDVTGCDARVGVLK